MVPAEVPSAGIAELRGLLATTFLASFQFFGAAEASYVTNLHLLTCLDARNGSRRWTRDGDCSRSLPYSSPSSLVSLLRVSGSSFARF